MASACAPCRSEEAENARFCSRCGAAISLLVAEGLLALADDRVDEGVENLANAVAREEELGLAYEAACLRLDLAQALRARVTTLRRDEYMRAPRRSSPPSVA